MGVYDKATTAYPGGRNQCMDDFLQEIKNKMKVLKKIKRKMGLSSRSGNSGGTNNLPPILFHDVHGENIRISASGAVAKRVESFCKGITFSSRPIKISEKVCVKFLEVSNNWSGVIRFGFTCNDPYNLQCGIPKYACPDLTNKPGYWAKALAERFAEKDAVLFYYVTAAGDVHFGINGEEKGVFLSGVETKYPLWALMDVYGNSTTIELLDPRQQHLMNNTRASGSASSSDLTESIIPSMSALSIQQQNQQVRRRSSGDEISEMVRVRYQPTGAIFSPLPFHRTKGQNIRLSNDRCIAIRSEAEFSNGYVFTARPILLGEKIVIQVLSTASVFVGAMAFGLTSRDPATLQSTDLPDDSDMLLDRPEYWVVSKDVASSPQRGDELSFCITYSGEVQLSKNGSSPIVFMHVDHTLQLWAFFDVYGSTQKVRILGSTLEPQPRSASGSRNSSPPPPPRILQASEAAPPPGRLRVNLPCTSPVQEPPPPAHPSHPPHPPQPPRMNFPPVSPPPPIKPELLQYQQSVGGGTVLVVNLPPPPPAHANYLNQQNQSNHHHQNSEEPHSSNTLMSTYSHTYIEPVSRTYASPDSVGNNIASWTEPSSVSVAGAECTICYERPVDSVLYMCGHMCMCYDCAIQQWRGKGGGHCPLCRAVIRDVIRTYKS